MSQHFTSIMCERKIVTVNSNQKKYWVEFQLLDELDKPVANMPYRAVNDATRCNHIKEYTGQSDASGVIRIEGLHPLELTLLIDAQPLADEMEKRTLRVSREPESSKVREVAEKEGHIWHYAVIGELCDHQPEIANWEPETPPEFHFPKEKAFKGFSVPKVQLDKRHVIEICPFRAWILKLHHSKDYSIVNAYNLGLLADLSYANESVVNGFFNEQCQNLSRIPQLQEYPSFYHSVSIDVPFSQRYTNSVFIDTSAGDAPAGHTQLFYVSNDTQVIVAWRGTEPDKINDVVTDGEFRPIPCPEFTHDGCVHQGFVKSFNLASEKYFDVFELINFLSRERAVFICGHSLGGALGLIYAASMKDFNPVIYTYGMPRVFTVSAVYSLLDIIHYRHVNDADTVTSIPPEADVDSWLYSIYGPTGTVLGGYWSFWKMLPQTTLGIKFGDPYWHHGNVVVFFKTEQSLMKQQSQPILWIGGGSDNTPSRTVYYKLTKKVKLYLVPSLNTECSDEAEDSQKKFVQCLDPDNLKRFFPKNTNPDLDSPITNPADHSMANQYMPFINNQLIELVDKDRDLKRKRDRKEFIEQMNRAISSGNDNAYEVDRNKNFIRLQEMLAVTLTDTLSDEFGKNALLRFNKSAEEEIEKSN